MIRKVGFLFVGCLALASLGLPRAAEAKSSNKNSEPFTQDFRLEDCTFSSMGRNPQLVEVSRKYFAICAPSNSVFYFGEEVDLYAGGVITGHDGSWLTGVNGAKPGLIMPGLVLLGARYFQEVATGVAMDQAEFVAMNQSITTPAGTFSGCVKTRETTPLEPKALEFKLYAPGIGLVQDDTLWLVQYGFVR